jgi:high-affinity iron transporter
MCSLRPVLFLLLVCGIRFGAVAAPGNDDQARTVVHMLDYVSVDYPVFVKNGQVLDSAEYAEQQEFAQQVLTLLSRIAQKADGLEVSALAKALRADVIMVYGVAVAPKQVPDLANGTVLYNAHCASCHGATGAGDGPQAEGLEPAPRNFHDMEAMEVRSPFGLYNTITLGVEGTSMLGYGALTDAERWDLAFYAASVGSDPDLVKRGEALWKKGEGTDQFTDLRALVTATPLEARQQHSADREAVLAFLVAHPEAVKVSAPSPLAITRAKLQEALEAYRKGDPASARQLSISAYLEGFELIEAPLDNVDAPLRRETEREMMALRSTIGANAPADSVAASIGRIQRLTGSCRRKAQRRCALHHGGICQFVVDPAARRLGGDLGPRRHHRLGDEDRQARCLGVDPWRLDRCGGTRDFHMVLGAHGDLNFRGQP